MIRNIKKFKVLAWILILALMFSSFSVIGPVPIAKAADNKVFDIVEITDFHGQLLDSTNTKPVGAALAKVVKDVKTANPDRTLIIGGGDLYQGTPVSNVLRGVPVQQVFSNMGMEVTALGNHEFDWGLDAINNTTMTGATYSIVCANMYDKGTSNRPYAPYKIITKDGVKIAVIGAILKEAPTIIMPALVEPFDFKDPATEINTVAKEIRDGNLADIVLADVHDGGGSLNTIVNNLQGVDAVFGGHTHSIADIVNKDADGKDVPTLIANSTGKGYIDLKITVDAVTKALTFSPKGSNYKALTTTVDSATDPECKKIVDDASAALLPIFTEVIGNDATAFTKDQVDSPYGESQLGNWMADVVRNYTASPADVGMVNNGGIRLSPIPAGDITVGTIFNIMPFDNTITTTTMTGAQLRFFFEQAVQTGGKGIQISGVKFTYDSSKLSYKAAVVATDGTITPEVLGQRVISITRESDGTVVNNGDTLKVNAPDFVATGGDMFTGFLVPSIVSSLVDSHVTVRDALNADVRAKHKITVVMNNRVVNKAATISVIATSDVHGNVLNFDYGTNAAPSTGQGLAKVSTYVKSLRAANPGNVMLIDNGDTVQGTPLVYYYNMIDKTTAYPMSAVMGAMEYDSWTLGNHEFNYGLETLNRITADAKNLGIDMLSANTDKADGTNFVEPYTIKSFVVNGITIKVAVLGLTTKTIPSWEDPAHYAGLHFNDLVDEAKKWVPIVKAAGADVVIVSAHTGEEGAADVIPENQAKALATQVSGIDAIVAGHAHSTLNDLTLKNPEGKVVPILEPGKWAQKVSQIDIAVDANGTVTGLTTENVTMGPTIAEDPAITALIAPYQAKTLEYTSTVLGQSTGEYKGNKQITEPTEIMELINKVQAGAAGTQLSIAAPLSLSAYIPMGNITIKDIMGVYVYENFLYGVKMTGKQVKDWMEYTERYYKQVSAPTDPILKDPTLNIADYNLDQLYGVSYDIDLTEPAGTIDPISKRLISGNRIKNLKYNGKLVKDSDVFTVAINNYRFNGGGGFMAAAGISKTDPSIVTYDSAKVLGDDGQVRSLMMKYVQDSKTITPSTSNNWKLSTNPVVVVPDPVLNNITITRPATKLTYTVGDALDLTGLEVTGTYSDGSTKIETVTAANVTGFNSAVRAARQTLTITLGGNTTTYNVKIKQHVFKNSHHWSQGWNQPH